MTNSRHNKFLSFIPRFIAEGDEVEHLPHPRAEAVAVEGFDFACGEVCGDVGDGLILHEIFVA